MLVYQCNILAPLEDAGFSWNYKDLQVEQI